jgi:hypothetical protein
LIDKARNLSRSSTSDGSSKHFVPSGHDPKIRRRMVDHCRHHHGVVERELPPSGGLTGGGACLFAVLIAVFGEAVIFLTSLFHQILDAIFSTSFVRALSRSFQFILISGAVRRAISKILCCCCDYGDRVPLELMHRGDDLCRQNGTGRMAACLKIRDKRRRHHARSTENNSRTADRGHRGLRNREPDREL